MKRKGTSGSPHQQREKRTKFGEESRPMGDESRPREAPPADEWNLFYLRKVYSGRKIDFEFFESEGFSIGNKIKDLGFESFCSINNPTYPSLVKEFYCNLRPSDEELISRVKGTNIIFDRVLLGSILNLSSEGDDREVLTEEERAEVVKLISGKKSLGEVKANDLPIEMRLLHHICGRIFVPKIGGFDRVTNQDLVLMKNILSGSSLNLPVLIMRRMLELKKKKDGCLPYGMALTEVFKHFQVGLENEDGKPLLGFDTYCAGTLHRMGYLKVGAQWIHKGKQAAEPSSEPVSPSPSEQRVEESSGPPDCAEPQPSAEERIHTESVSRPQQESDIRDAHVLPVSLAPVSSSLTREQLDYIAERTAEILKPEFTRVLSHFEGLNSAVVEMKNLLRVQNLEVKQLGAQIKGHMDEALHDAHTDILEVKARVHSAHNSIETLGTEVKGYGSGHGVLLEQINETLLWLKDKVQLVFNQIEAHFHAACSNTALTINALGHLLERTKSSPSSSSLGEPPRMTKYFSADTHALLRLSQQRSPVITQVMTDPQAKKTKDA